MSPSKQRRLQRQRAAAAELGMSFDQWIAWRAVESAARPARIQNLRRMQRAYGLREREARFASGSATHLDRMDVYTEAVIDSFSKAMDRHLLYGGRR